VSFWNEPISKNKTAGLIVMLAVVVVMVAWMVSAVVKGGGATKESSACLRAFKSAAAVSRFQDTNEDLFPAFRACGSLEEWRAASDKYPDALDGADPDSYAKTVCEQNAAVMGTPICNADLG